VVSLAAASTLLLGVQVIGGLAGASASLSAGKASQRAYQLQAKQAALNTRLDVLRTRTELLNHKRQGIAILEKTASDIATLNARAAAGAINPFSGSILNTAELIRGRGVRDFDVTVQNRRMLELEAQLLETGGALQQQEYELAGRNARHQGYVNALNAGLDVASAVGRYSLSRGGGNKDG